ncbi:hypothetical protein EI94DRAFT_1622902, partial [Lactarius quietus]
CKEFCRNSHQQLPFHRVQRWTGKYFIPSWLCEVRISLHLGHFGDPCPLQNVRFKPLYVQNPILKATVTK